jgi:hypothetical protein
MPAMSCYFLGHEVVNPGPLGSSSRLAARCPGLNFKSALAPPWPVDGILQAAHGLRVRRKSSVTLSMS